MPTMLVHLGMQYSSLPNADIQPSFLIIQLRQSDSHSKQIKLINLYCFPTNIF